MNPLLNNHALPAFDQIRPEHVEPAIDQLLKAADAALEYAVSPDVPADYDAHHAFQRQRFAGINFLDARVRQWRVQNLSDEHAGHAEIVGVFARAGGLGR